ncbi:MAG: hypothetical protein IT257_01275 [Chitinophagaceae bacterium]|nr:hypothetical protein [Chitinophagaceae bacterium]
MKNQSQQNPYKNAQRFADVTKEFIIAGNIQRAKRCLQKAESIFVSGNQQVRNAISNVYVYSVSSFMEVHRCSIRSLFPESLNNEYLQQINTSGD